MSDTDHWLTEYGVRHQNIGHPAVYWLSVIMLIIANVGLLWAIPVPAEFVAISPLLNWGTVFLLAAVIYYFIISLPLAFGMLPFVVAIAAFHLWLQNSPYSALPASVGLAAGALIGLVVGQYRGNGLRGVLSDIQLMMIAPVWLLSRLYRRLGIPH